MSGHSAPEKNSTVKPLLKFMREQGWRAYRNEVGFVPGAGSYGEKGMPDYKFIRYLEKGVAYVVWVEAKQPGFRTRCNCRPAGRNPETGRPTKAHVCRSCAQKRWAEAETALGAIVLQVDDVEVFKRWYLANFGFLAAPAKPQLSLFEEVE